MRYLWNMLVLSVLLSTPGYAQPVQLAWEQALTFAPAVGNVFGYLNQLGNGDFLASGIRTTGRSAYPFIYARVQPGGTVVYQRTGRTLGTLEQDVAPLPGGGGLLAASVPGRTMVGNNGTTRLFFQRLRANGDTLPGVSYPVTTLEGYPVRSMREGDSVRVLTYAIDAQGGGQYALLATDTLGTLGQMRRYENPVFGNAYPCDLVRTARGGWLLLGDLSAPSYFHPYLVETDAQGRLRRQRDHLLFAGSTDETVWRVWNNLVRLRDGSGYVFSGQQQTGGSRGPIQGFLCKLDTALNVVWTYRHPAQATTQLQSGRVYELADGTLTWLVGDKALQSPQLTPYLYLVRVSAAGQLLSQATVNTASVPGCKRVFPYAWQPLGGGGALVVGYAYPDACPGVPGTYAAYVARLANATAPLAAAAPARAGDEVTVVYPNPAAETATWQGAVPVGAKRAELVLSDVLGRARRRWLVAGRGALVRQALDLGGLPAGSYGCRLLLDGQPSGAGSRLLVGP